jgi:hypothetical protein
MKKLKDIFYDLNDIMVALIIVSIAAAVIMVNINSILDYPTAVAAAAPAADEKTPTDYADNPPITNDPTSSAIDQNGEDTTDDQNTTGGSVNDQPGNETQNLDKYAVYINSGETGDQIADKLISVGLFKNRQEFRDAVTAAGAEGKLKAGNFIIPSDATPAEVIAILTK